MDSAPMMIFDWLKLIEDSHPAVNRLLQIPYLLPTEQKDLEDALHGKPCDKTRLRQIYQNHVSDLIESEKKNPIWL